ncbi:transposase [Streptomyces atratus]|uniref:Putative transposase of IS4/5 family n=1 Tax=Streptomyces atratus TaxID=1893 RepID=A0A1K2F6U2_STRAR|nr:transposase [Streptomyces atratus]SFY43126.1 Putative transposase of IS4/5 family [Streptomyces atratus]
MPADFPPWDRVYAFFRRWRDHGMVKVGVYANGDRAREMQARGTLRRLLRNGVLVRIESKGNIAEYRLASD